MIIAIIRSSEKPTTTATVTSECAVQSHQKSRKKRWNWRDMLPRAHNDCRRKSTEAGEGPSTAPCRDPENQRLLAGLDVGRGIHGRFLLPPHVQSQVVPSPGALYVIGPGWWTTHVGHYPRRESVQETLRTRESIEQGDQAMSTI